MSNMLGSKAWERSKLCKRRGCCMRPRHSKAAMRTRESLRWQKDAFEESAPDYPDWIDRYAHFQTARFGFPLYRDV